MLWYVIKYNQSLWTIEKKFSQVSSAEEYKTVLDKRNTSSCNYFVECSPLGPKFLPKIVEYRLNQFKNNPQKKVDKAA